MAMRSEDMAFTIPLCSHLRKCRNTSAGATIFESMPSDMQDWIEKNVERGPGPIVGLPANVDT